VSSLPQRVKNIGQRLLSEKGFALVMMTLGTLSIAAGIHRFRVRPEPFGLLSGLGCLVAAVAGFFLLLIADYVFHHARLVFVLWFILLIGLILVEPHFAVGMGLALWVMLEEQLRG